MMNTLYAGFIVNEKEMAARRRQYALTDIQYAMPKCLMNYIAIHS